MVDYGRSIQFGVFVTPAVDLIENSYAIAEIADESLDFIGVQDHPYQPRFLDAWAFMSTLLAHTDTVRLIPDVANTALHNAAVLAKTAASLDVLSGGRMELALGAGAFWEAITAMGGTRRTPKDAAQSLREAVAVTRLMWSGERSARYDGDFHRLAGVHPGPMPAHDMQIWLGVGGPNLLHYLGGHADGWLPSNTYFGPEKLPAMNERIDKGAADAGRDPSLIIRAYNIFGRIGGGPGSTQFDGPVSQWVDDLTALAVNTGMDTFIFGAPDDNITQVRRFAEDVVPLVRANVTAIRRQRHGARSSEE